MAIEMATEGVDRGDDPEVIAMARDVIHPQTAAIATLQRIKSQLSVGAAHEPPDEAARSGQHLEGDMFDAQATEIGDMQKMLE
jgi:uncharacterized protein (DUF305 family)